MAKPDVWMPVYIGDYLKHTGRLSTAGHGAYLLLLFDHWVNGPIDDDDETLASVTRLPLKDWQKLRPKLEGFFQITDGKWHSKRATEEGVKASDISSKRREAGSKGAKIRWQNDSKQIANAIENEWQNDRQSQSQSERDIQSNINTTAVPDTARAPKGDAAAEGLHPRYREVTERVAKLLDNPNLLVFGQVDGWLKAGADPEADIYPTLLRLKPEWRTGSLKYFSKPIAEALASRATLDVSGAVTIAPPDPNADLAESDRRWISRLQGFDQRGFWLEDDWGPKPGDAGHRCPTWLTERYRQQKQRAA